LLKQVWLAVPTALSPAQRHICCCCAVATLAARLQRVLASQYMVTEPQIKQPEELAAQEATTEPQVRARMAHYKTWF